MRMGLGWILSYIDRVDQMMMLDAGGTDGL